MSTVPDLVSSIAGQYGVDPALALAVAQVESGFSQSAVSSAGAIGVMQLMPATASDLGVDPRDLIGNITGGVRLLSSLLARYGGDLRKTLWAYNAGPGRVDAGQLPAETQTYIARVLSAYTGYSASGATAPGATAVPPASGLLDQVRSSWSSLVGGISTTTAVALGAALVVVAIAVTAADE